MTKARNVADIIKQPFTTTLGTSNYRAGVNAGNSIASGGNFNVVVGDEAGTAITTGLKNVAVGMDAMGTNVDGDGNVAVGYQALKTMEPANGFSFNTAVGAQAGLSVTSSVKNTLIGSLAGDGITSGDGLNVAVGVGALGAASNNTQENVAIGNDALSTEDGHGRNVAVGFEALKTLNAGALALNTAVGQQAGKAMTTGVNNTLIGGQAGDALTDADFNVAVGRNALSADTLGSTSIAIGHAALETQNFTSAANTYNVAIGHVAGQSITTGSVNTLIGGLSGDAITTGVYNVTLGVSTLGANTGAHKNTAIGSNSMVAFNVTSNTDTFNTAVGYGSAIALTTGVQNTFVGALAGDDLTTGSNNTIIGYGCNINAVGQDHGIALGHNVGVSANDFSFGKSGNKVTNDFDTDANWSRSSDERLKKNITDQTLGLDFINDLRTVKYNWKASNELDSSDSQLAHLYKENPADNEMNTNATMHNFIAQEVKAALDTAGVSNFAGWKEDEKGVQQVSREMFVIPLVKAIQELSAKNDALAARIATLEG